MSNLGKPVGRTFAKKGAAKTVTFGGGTPAGMAPSGASTARTFDKKGQDSKKAQTAHSKHIQEQKLDTKMGDAVSFTKAPTSRVYTGDYQKVGRSPDDKDIASPYLGNPLRR